MLEWIYVQPVSVSAFHHIISKGGQIRPVEFWWDIRAFDGHEMLLAGKHGQVTARLTVFQEGGSEVPGHPRVWSLVQLSAQSEFEAAKQGSYLAHEHCARITLLTGVPFRPSGHPRLVQLDSTKFGWDPYFESSEFKGVDFYLGAPMPDPENPNEIIRHATRRVPLHTPIVGTVKHDDILHIGFSDTIRQIDRNTQVDVGSVRINASSVAMGLKKTDQTTPNVLLTQICALYSSALAQDEPSNQFILLWAAVETLVNSVSGQPMLDDATITSAVDVIDIRGLDRERIASAMRQVTVETFKDRVATSFIGAFGRCLAGTEKTIADLRTIRGRLLHPQVGHTDFSADLINGLSTLKEVIEKHLEIVRSSLHNSP